MLRREPNPLLAHYPYDKSFVGPSGAFPFPKSQFWMGTDLIGRDVYSRIVYAARVSLSIGVLSQVIALSIGVPLGGIAGWRGGKDEQNVLSELARRAVALGLSGLFFTESTIRKAPPSRT